MTTDDTMTLAYEIKEKKHKKIQTKDGPIDNYRLKHSPCNWAATVQRVHRSWQCQWRRRHKS